MNSDDPERGHASFLTTRWSIVLAAGASSAPNQRAALEELCTAYWYPLYAFVRRKGYDAETSRDLVQEFFSRLLERNDFSRADPSKGRFRAYLLTALKHFLINEAEHARAQKRGGGRKLLPLEFPSQDAETRYSLEPALTESPDRAFDREWALIVLQRALLRLESEQLAAGKTEEWRHLSPHLTASDSIAPYAELTTALGKSENAIKISVHRLRKRYGDLLREEVADTLGGSSVDAELSVLFDVLGGPAV